MSKLIVKISFFARHLFVKLRNRPSIARKMSQKVNSLRGHGQGGLGLLVKQVLSRKTRGIGLIETLVGGAIGSIIIAGSMKSLQLSLESSQVAHASLSEAEFRHMINQFFTPNDNQKCLDNFAHLPTKPTGPDYDAIGLFGNDSKWGVGEVFKLDSSIPLVKGKTFKGALEIVKMELKGELPTPKDANTELKIKKATRHFIVYYKKIGMGSYNTVGGADCQAEDTANNINEDLTGCYFNHCALDLKLADPNKECKSTCTAISGGGGGGSGSGGNPDCYQVEDSSTGKTLVGCRSDTETSGTSQITAIGFNAGKANTTGIRNTFLGAKAGEANISSPENTFIGHRAGKKYTGPTTGAVGRNTFIGSQAGRDTTTGEKNTFIGTWAGRVTTTGDNNIAIGVNALLDSATGDNQINIGNIIKAERKTDSDDSTKKMGVLKVCNPGGDDGDGKCIELSKKSLACPANQYFRGIDDNGNPICQQERCTPQTGIYFWKPENQCHYCPRASPLYVESRKNAPPTDNCPMPMPECCKCAPNSTYILTGTNKNTCRDACRDQYSNFADIGDCPCPDGQVWVDVMAGNPNMDIWVCQDACNTIKPYGTWVNGICVCRGHFPHDYGGRCNRCPQATPHYHGGRCNKCRSNQVVSNGHCCPQATPHYHGGRCNKCRSNQVVSNGHCCPQATPHHHGGRCNKCRSNQVVSNGHCCPQATPHYHGGRCNKCRSNQVVSNGHCCPQATPHYHGGRCNKCRSNQVVSNGHCCPLGFHYGGNGTCCLEGLHWNGSSCVSCTGGVWTDNTCQCNAGQTLVNGRCKCNKVGHILVDGVCKCPDGFRYYKNYRKVYGCYRCPFSQRWNGSSCVNICAWQYYPLEDGRCLQLADEGSWNRCIEEKWDDALCIRQW